jgi:hypothetical protein
VGVGDNSESRARNVVRSWVRSVSLALLAFRATSSVRRPERWLAIATAPRCLLCYRAGGVQFRVYKEALMDCDVRGESLTYPSVGWSGNS